MAVLGHHTTAKAPAVNLLRLNTLRDTETAFV